MTLHFCEFTPKLIERSGYHKNCGTRLRKDRRSFSRGEKLQNEYKRLKNKIKRKAKCDKQSFYNKLKDTALVAGDIVHTAELASSKKTDCGQPSIPEFTAAILSLKAGGSPGFE